MEGWIWALTVILLGGLMTIFYDFWKNLYFKSDVMNWPPGPKKLPIIGNLHQLNSGGELVHVNLAKLAQEHGSMMTVWFGSSGPTIIVSNHELAWEVLVNKASDFSSRTLPYMSKLTSADWQTLATSNLGPYWQKLRKGLHNTTLNPHTMSAQTRLQEADVSNMLTSLRIEASSNDGVVKPLLHFRRLTIQLIGRLCFGPQFNDDIFVNSLDDAIEEVIRLSGHARLVDVFELSRYIPGLNLRFEEASRLKHKIEQLFLPYIANHKFSFQTCYLHFLLSQNFSKEIIIFNLFEMFLLAVDSTSTATAWALTFLIHDQQIQQKLYEEVQRETGSEALQAEKVNKLLYLHAVVKETMRMRPIAPLAVPHRAVRDSKLMGTKIVEGTPVMVNLYAVHHDPSIWVEPYRFMPDRFMTSSVDKGAESDVSLVRNMERSFLPFGAGRRICAGMDLAKLQVAFTLASLINNFHWSSVAEDQLPDLSEDLTFVLRMKTPLMARIISRSS
ncbi:hypothetical protein AQUCO_01200087v1 [Aquilegia coerulea]|uniref:Cytochrome P450 n=1 Tax=Aquilegia coerulea TaxID=218851 RepID=A0A2G5E4E1_AQUCA|nr:hypothetical protein AQUCO_01200087v1 [Aquilegia coerulea]